MPEQLLQQAASSSMSSSVDCRVHERLACDVPTTCRPTSSWSNKDARWAASISDVSLSGLRLIVRRRFEVGAGLGIELPGNDGEEPCTVLARVVHVKAMPDGSWALGCKFISELGDDELLRLTTPKRPPEPKPLAPSRHPQAASEKQSVSGVVLHIETDQGKLFELRIKRLAVPGTWPTRAGNVLTIGIGKASTLKVEVVRCDREEDRWTVRCRLVQPSWDALIRTLGGPRSSGPA